MDGKSRGSVEFLVANVALEMFGLLVINEHLVIIKFSVAIPTCVKEVQLYIVHTNTLHVHVHLYLVCTSPQHK